MPDVCDIALISDFRFPGGTSSAVAEEIKANAAAGYRTTLVHLEARNLTFPFALNPRIRALLDQGLATLHDPERPLRARLALVHNPYTVARLPLGRLDLQAEHRLLVAHHPPCDAAGEPYYDAPAAHRNAGAILAGSVVWAPVGPRVREQLGRIDPALPLTAGDWHDVFDPAAWAVAREPGPRPNPVIGRHSRPDPRKWPDTRDEVLLAYPDDPRVRVRVLGGGPFLVERVGLYPRNWQVLPFGALAPQEFLRGLDVFVYFHGSRWVEAFGCAIAEALASGVPAILPPHFEELFGEAAIYCEAEGVLETVLALHADRAAWQRQSERGRALVAERFSPAAHLARVAALIGPPQPRALAAGAGGKARERAPKRVLFFSSNGVGMGHLTRLLAIARRLPDGFEPVFVTMSQAIRIIKDAGYHAEYVPYHQYLGCDIYHWNRHLRHELNEMLGFYAPAVVVCDFNSPFQGVIDAAADNPARWFVWCRRGMWRAGVGAKFIERQRSFDLVLEPRDFAGEFDAGLTAQSRALTREVAPIRLLHDGEVLPREVARRELGLDPDRPALIFMLGAGNNFDYGTLRRLALDHLAGRRDVQLAVADWLMSTRPADVPDGAVRVQRFPLARWLGAFDAAISAVGYNSFHELLTAGIPTLFVPNENPQQDDQLARARWAERRGLALCVRTQEVYRLKPALERLLDPAERAEMAERSAGLDRTNGAEEASRAIVELAHIGRTDKAAGH
jgi:glycosyltransferase involved in cell wall biosynthesis